jgi:hypothetical protein
MMWNSGNGTRNLSADDQMAISVLYDVLADLGGKGAVATDIAVGGAANTIWKIGNDAVAGGYSIAYWKPGLPGFGNKWVTVPGGAVRIAVARGGIPWVVNANGEIFRRTAAAPNDGNWDLMPGWAYDIGAGADGSVWVVGVSPLTNGFGMLKWNGSQWTPDGTDVGGLRISVDSTGIPWMVNDKGAVFRRTSTDPSSGSWTKLPSPLLGANDIAVSVRQEAGRPGGLAWISHALVVGAWDEQPGVAEENGAPEVQAWRSPFASILATSVAVDSRGNPYFVGGDGVVWTSRK